MIDFENKIKELGFKEPTDIQALTFARFGEKNNLLIKSKTGSGKTLAYLLPSIDYALTNPTAKVLIVSPTNELSFQIFDVLKKIGYSNMATLLTNRKNDTNFQKKQVYIGTFSKMVYLIANSWFDHNGYNILIIDEADMMFSDILEEDVSSLVSQLPNSKKICVSASLNSNFLGFIKKYFGTYSLIESINNKLAISYYTYKIYQKTRFVALQEIFNKINPYLCFIFCSHSKDISLIYDKFHEKYNIIAYTSGISVSRRKQILAEIRDNKYQYVITTDVLSRGMDFEASHIINYDIPSNIEYLMHRIGRVGRANQTGEVYSILSSRDIEPYSKVVKDSDKSLDENKRKNPRIATKIKAALANIDSEPRKIKPNYRKKHKAKVEKVVKKILKVSKYSKGVKNVNR